jgi:PIN domain nuclease of toxin-antitoxin system
MTRVVDTSAIMAILLDEHGQEVAARLVSGGVLSSVNFAEILTKCIERAVPPDVARIYIRDAGIDVVPFDADHALVSAELFSKARKGVLSLGDRACIATAIARKATVVTADRIWATLDLGCPVELIR